MNSLPIKKHVFEIKFQPLPSFLDKKGQITETLVNDIFDTWQVNPTRTDLISTKHKNITCYITYLNYGLVSESPNSTELFIQQSQELIRKLWTIIPADRIHRFGVRTYQIHEDERKHEALVKIYNKNFFSSSTKNFSSFGGKLTDIGIALNFDNQENARFNLSSGPMLRAQAMQFFADQSLLPKVGIFTDTDFFNDNSMQLSSFRQKDFLELIEKGIAKAEHVQKVITGILNKKKKT